MFSFVGIVVVVGFQNIWKKEGFEDEKHDHQLHYCHYPECLAHAAHAGET